MITFKSFYESNVSYSRGNASDKVSDYLYDMFGDLPNVVKEIEKKCPQFVSDIGGSQNLHRWVMFRGIGNKIPREELVMYKVKRNRTPRDTPQQVHDLADYFFLHQFGIRVRSETLFVTGSLFDASEYGQPAVVFPIGSYTFFWSPVVGDFADIAKYFGAGISYGSIHDIVGILVVAGVHTDNIINLISQNFEKLTSPPDIDYRTFDKATLLQDLRKKFDNVSSMIASGVDITKNTQLMYDLIRAAILSYERPFIASELALLEARQITDPKEIKTIMDKLIKERLSADLSFSMQMLRKEVAPNVESALNSYRKGGDIKEALASGHEIMLYTNSVLLLDISEYRF